jgi:non-heme chloroperoxidase
VVPDVGRYAAATVRSGRASFYAGIGHAPFWEDADRFNRELSEFVTSAKNQ